MEALMEAQQGQEVMTGGPVPQFATLAPQEQEELSTFVGWLEEVAVFISPIDRCGAPEGTYVTEDRRGLTPVGSALVALLEEMVRATLAEGEAHAHRSSRFETALQPALDHLQAARAIARGLRVPARARGDETPDPAWEGLHSLYRALAAACRAAGVEPLEP